MRNCKWWSVFSNSLLVLVSVISWSSLAAVNVDRTRVVFASNALTQSINLANDSATPMLIQVWTDTGDPRIMPDRITTPVVVMPPVFKMQPGELRSLRLILSSRQGMATDRENLLWLNIYQIAPKTEDAQAGGQKVTLPLRLRLKMFIRPVGVGMPQTEDDEKLVFTANGDRLNIVNPTPWYVSLVVALPGQPPVKNLMVSPQGNLQVPLPAPVAPGSKLVYSVITDDGNTRVHTKTL